MTGTAHTGPSPATGQSVVTIGQFFTTLRRQWAIVLVMVLLGLTAAVALLAITEKTYQATAVVDISPLSGGRESSVSTITESRIVTSTKVAEGAQKRLPYEGTATELASHVTVTSPLASQVLNITFVSDDAQGAKEGANAFARAYLDYRIDNAQQDIARRIGRIQSQVADLQRSLAALRPGQNDNQRGSLQSQIQQLQNQLNTYQTSVVNAGTVAGEATAPLSPSSPKPAIYLAGGLLIGLLLGIILAVARDRRDDRLRDSAELEHSLGAVVITEFLADEGGSRQPWSLAATAAARSAEADAYRTITTAVTSHSHSSRVVLVCGTGQDRLSLAPLNLAATFATQGLRTVIAGPEHAVQPAIELLQVQSLPAWPGARLVDQLTPSKQLPDLLVLSLGDEVSLGATLRANDDSFADILDTVDMIVLDGVNIELPSTSLRLGQIADEAVVVAYKSHSTHAEIERLARQLAQVGVTVLGGILLSRRSGWRGTVRRRRRAGRTPRHPAGGGGHRELATAGPAWADSHPAQTSEAAGATGEPAAQGSDTAARSADRRPGSSGPTTRPGSARSASARKS